jgi:hypothetical protein
MGVLVNDETEHANDYRDETHMKTFCGKVVAATGICLLGILPLRSAAADPSITDKSIATQLFKEGRALLEQGRVAPACRKLEESQRIDPGGGTLLNLALCHEREGRTATAWVEFTEALGIAKKDERMPRVEFARTHLAQLESSLSRLLIEVSSSADIPDLEIKRDGTVVGRAAWGSSVPVDPGDHVVEASASGKIPWKQAVVVGTKADAKTVLIPVLEDSPTQEKVSRPPPLAMTPLAPPSPTTVQVVSAPAQSVPERSSTSTAGSSVPAWIAFGVGTAGAAIGTYYGFHAISLKNDADRNCPNGACSAQGVAQTSDAIRSADFATAGFAVGVLGLGLGAILFVTRPSPHETTPAVNQAAIAPAMIAGDVAIGRDRSEFTISGRW